MTKRQKMLGVTEYGYRQIIAHLLGRGALKADGSTVGGETLYRWAD